MNIFDIPELALTEEERIKVGEMFMFEHFPEFTNIQQLTESELHKKGQINFNGLVFLSAHHSNYLRDLAKKFFTDEYQPVGCFGAVVQPGITVEVHTDNYSSSNQDNNWQNRFLGDSGWQDFLDNKPVESDNALMESLPFYSRRTVVCFPITPKENYSRLYYPDTQESRGWSDHAYSFDTFQPHGVEYNDTFRLNLQFSFTIPFNDFYEIYKSGHLVRS